MSLWDVYSISAYAFVFVLHFILCHCLWINRSVPIVPKPRAVPTLLRMPESSTDLQGTLLCTRSVGSAHSPFWRSPHCTYAVSPYSENFIFFKGPEMNKICVRQAWVTQITPRKSQLNFRFITEPAYAKAVTHPILQLYSNPHLCLLFPSQILLYSQFWLPLMRSYTSLGWTVGEIPDSRTVSIIDRSGGEGMERVILTRPFAWFTVKHRMTGCTTDCTRV